MRMARKRGEDSENGVPDARDSENDVLRGVWTDEDNENGIKQAVDRVSENGIATLAHPNHPAP